MEGSEPRWIIRLPALPHGRETSGKDSLVAFTSSSQGISLIRCSNCAPHTPARIYRDEAFGKLKTGFGFLNVVPTMAAVTVDVAGRHWVRKLGFGVI
jgi:hypothetical protein